jgi:hypothetical protein
MGLSKFFEQLGEVSKRVSLVRCLSRRVALPNQRELEPKPIFGRIGDSGYVALRHVRPTNKLVQGVLVRVRIFVEMAYAPIIFGDEHVPHLFWQTAYNDRSALSQSLSILDLHVPSVWTVEPSLKIAYEALFRAFEVVQAALGIGQRVFGIPSAKKEIYSSPDRRVVYQLDWSTSH